MAPTATATAATTRQVRPADTPPLAPGQLFASRYAIIAALGRGGSPTLISTGTTCGMKARAGGSRAVSTSERFSRSSATPISRRRRDI